MGTINFHIRVICGLWFELARRLNIAPTLADRLLSLRHQSRIEQIETALASLGKKLVVDVA